MFVDLLNRWKDKQLGFSSSAYRCVSVALSGLTVIRRNIVWLSFYPLTSPVSLDLKFSVCGGRLIIIVQFQLISLLSQFMLSQMCDFFQLLVYGLVIFSAAWLVLMAPSSTFAKNFLSFCIAHFEKWDVILGCQNSVLRCSTFNFES